MADNTFDPAASAVAPAAFAPARLSPQQRRAAVAQAALLQSQSRDQFRQNLATSKLDQTERHFEITSDRGEREFNEKTQLDSSRLSLEQQAHLLQETKVLSDLALQRFQMEQDRRKQLSAAMGISAVGQLDPTDKDFKKKYYDIVGQYSDGLEHPGMLKVLEQKQGDFERYTAAQANRSVSTFSGPAAKAYDASIAAGQDPAVANKYAESIQFQLDRQNKIIGDPDLPPGALADPRVYDPSTHQFNPDVAETLIAEARGRRMGSENQDKDRKDKVDDLTKILDALKPHDVPRDMNGNPLPGSTVVPDSPERTAARQSAERALKTLTASYEGTAAAPAGQSPASDYINAKKSLSLPTPAAPAVPVAPVNPATPVAPATSGVTPPPVKTSSTDTSVVNPPDDSDPSKQTAAV